MIEQNHNVQIVKNKLMQNRALITNIIESLENSRFRSSSVTDPPPSIPTIPDKQTPDKQKNVSRSVEQIQKQPEPELLLKTEQVPETQTKPVLPAIMPREQKKPQTIQEDPKNKDTEGEIWFEFNEEESGKDQEEQGSSFNTIKQRLQNTNIVSEIIKEQEESLQPATAPMITEFVEPQPKKSVKKSGKKGSKKFPASKVRPFPLHSTSISGKRTTRAQQKTPNTDLSLQNQSKQPSSKEVTLSSKSLKSKATKVNKIKTKKEAKASKILSKGDSKANVSPKPMLQPCQFQIVVAQDTSIMSIIKKLHKNTATKSKPQLKTPQKNGFSQSKLQPVDFEIVVSLLTGDPKPRLISRQKNLQKQKFKLGEARRLEKIVSDRELYIEQAEKGGGTKINLGGCSLLEVVELLKDEGIIQQELFDKFSQNHTIYDIMDFLQKFTAGQLESFQFKTISFTLLDHRRLTELATKLFPNKYAIGEVTSINKDVHTFLQSLYELHPKRYFQLYNTIDNISKITWWKKIIDKNKDQILKACATVSSVKKAPAEPQKQMTSSRLIRKSKA